MSTVEGTVVMVTGGSKGIGAEAVRQFVREGAKYVAILDIDEEAGISLQKELTDNFSANIKYIKCDVTNDEDLTAAYNEVIEDNGYIDVVINNAGIANESGNMYKKLIEINFTATVTSTIKAIELMHKDLTGRGGTIINTSSVTALKQDPFLPIYYSTKSAVLQFSNCIGSKENYKKTGVKVMVFCYGATDTGIFEGNLSTYDNDTSTEFNDFVNSYYRQRVDSAAKSLVEVCKRGESGTTWLSRADAPVVDITTTVQQAYGLLSATLPTK